MPHGEAPAPAVPRARRARASRKSAADPDREPPSPPFPHGALALAAAVISLWWAATPDHATRVAAQRCPEILEGSKLVESLRGRAAWNADDTLLPEDP